MKRIQLTKGFHKKVDHRNRPQFLQTRSPQASNATPHFDLGQRTDSPQARTEKGKMDQQIAKPHSTL